MKRIDFIKVSLYSLPIYSAPFLTSCHHLGDAQDQPGAPTKPKGNLDQQIRDAAGIISVNAVRAEKQVQLCKLNAKAAQTDSAKEIANQYLLEVQTAYEKARIASNNSLKFLTLMATSKNLPADVANDLSENGDQVSKSMSLLKNKALNPPISSASSMAEESPKYEKLLELVNLAKYTPYVGAVLIAIDMYKDFKVKQRALTATSITNATWQPYDQIN